MSRKYCIYNLIIFCLLFHIDVSARVSYQGYMEGEYTYLSLPTSGKLLDLKVSRGDQVQQGQLLGELEPKPELLAVKEAEKKIAQVKAKLSDIRKGERPSEIAVWQAKLSGIQAELIFHEKSLNRRQDLFKTKAIEEESLNRAKMEYEKSKAKLEEILANITTSKLGGRSDQIVQVENELKAVEVFLQKALWWSDQKQLIAPITARVFDTYYMVGEYIKKETPILSLLAANDIKCVFYIPEPMLSKVKVGDLINVSCDNCRRGNIAKITYISTQADYTPPVIYSETMRSKLVYRVEAKLTKSKGDLLNPGQPIDVYLK